MDDKVVEFLESRTDEINEVVRFYPEKKSLIIDYANLEKHDLELADELRRNPDEVLSKFESALLDMDLRTLAGDVPVIHVRVNNFPKERGYNLMIREINAEYIGKMVAVDGIVNRIGDVLPKVSNALFKCNKCGEDNWVAQDKRALEEPLKCRRGCSGRNFRFIPEESKWVDVQRLEIQEPLELLKGGEQARRIEVWVEDDLTDVVTAGNKIVVTGILRLQPPKQKSSIYYKFLEANYVEAIEREFEAIDLTKEDEKKIKKFSKDPKVYDKIIGSIAPSIYGFNEVKEAIALQLFSGRPGKQLPDGTSVRPDIHLLLVGDPGVAKSKMLQYVDQIAPKSVYVTGKGTTGAGLTASAEKSDLAEGSWTLKAGALVLAGGGIAAIDEFDKMDPEDRSAMHEAMEQQTISVAKAGIIARFKANTSILAASNPKFSRFDKYKPLHEQFDIPPTLISRFDLIFPIRDVLDRETDRNIAEHILKMHKTDEVMHEIEPAIEPELFRKYIAYARINCKPILTEEASKKLIEYYVTLRSSSADSVPATPRQLEALIRLSEASAKIRLSNEVTVDDAERAITLTNFVLREIAYDEATGVFDIDRIMTDHPKSTRDRIRIVENIINDLLALDSGGAPYNEIVEQAQEQGVDKFRAEQIINELKSKGVIYEPRHGRFLLTEE